MTKSEVRFFKLAENASEMSDFPKQKLGCVIVYKNKVISVGWNTTKENPMQKKYNQLRGFDVNTSRNSLHAEMFALLKIRHLDIDFSKVKIFVFRRFKNGKLALSHPCVACIAAIKSFGISSVYYTDIDGFHKILL